MGRDIDAVHRVVGELLTNVQERRLWCENPSEYAASRLGRAEACAVARLDPERVGTAALHLDMRRVTSPTTLKPRNPGSPPARANFRDASVEGIPNRPDRASGPVRDQMRVGLGFWPDLYMRFEESELVEVWEHRVDDYLRDQRLLVELANRGTVVMHSVGLSVGSRDVICEPDQIHRVGDVLRSVDAHEFSDHLAFSQIGDIALDHFVPVWRVQETLDQVVANVTRVQDSLGVLMALENIAPIFDIGGELSEAEFLNEVVERTGCGLLLDITNLGLCDANGFCDAQRELGILNLEAVIGVHLSGGASSGDQHFDAHAFPVADQDVRVLSDLLPLMPRCQSIIIERDGRRGSVDEVQRDLRRVHAAVG